MNRDKMHNAPKKAGNCFEFPVILKFQAPVNLGSNFINKRLSCFHSKGLVTLAVVSRSVV